MTLEDRIKLLTRMVAVSIGLSIMILVFVLSMQGQHAG